MALRFVLDEHFRGRQRAVIRNNLLGGLPIDSVCVGDSADLPLGSPDPLILHWAAAENRILVTLDRDTMPAHLQLHLANGGHSPGVLVLHDRMSWAEMIGYLALVAHAGSDDEFRDVVRFAS